MEKVIVETLTLGRLNIKLPFQGIWEASKRCGIRREEVRRVNRSLLFCFC